MENQEAKNEAHIGGSGLNAGLGCGLKFPWEIEGEGFWSKQGREKYRQDRINAIPQNTPINITLKDEIGIFNGMYVDGKFLMNCGGIMDGYWMSKVSNWAYPNVKVSGSPTDERTTE